MDHLRLLQMTNRPSHVDTNGTSQLITNDKWTISFFLQMTSRPSHFVTNENRPSHFVTNDKWTISVNGPFHFVTNKKWIPTCQRLPQLNNIGQFTTL